MRNVKVQRRGELGVLGVFVAGMASEEKAGIGNSSSNRNRGELTQFMTVDDEAAPNDVMSGVWGRGARPSGKSRGQCRLHAPRVSMESSALLPDVAKTGRSRPRDGACSSTLDLACSSLKHLASTSGNPPPTHVCCWWHNQRNGIPGWMEGWLLIGLMGRRTRMWRCLAPTNGPAWLTRDRQSLMTNLIPHVSRAHRSFFHPQARSLSIQLHGR